VLRDASLVFREKNLRLAAEAGADAGPAATEADVEVSEVKDG
jgi:hypothetical protein